MKRSQAMRLLKARTPYDLLCVTSPNVARLLRVQVLALLPPDEQRHVRGTRGGAARLARVFLDLHGGTAAERALRAFRIGRKA